VLIITASITNCGSTFVSFLSFARSEAKLSFDFIFDSLKKHVFYDPYPVPCVVVSDQAAGIKASMPIALPNSILQFCDWHVVKNVEKRLFDKGYPKEKEEEEEEEKEEEKNILPSSTAPAILSRAGRKRAPTLKALEAEKAPKRGTGQGRVGRGRGRGN
jgi:hypothetical protein